MGTASARRHPYSAGMSFDVAASAYGRFMGRYSEPLAPLFADFAGVAPGHRALDVGCGPGALTAILVERLGADAVSAVDPSEPFVVAARERLPGVDVARAAAESLPFPDDSFDITTAQLVVHFMADPVVGLAEMARVTRPGGVVTACVWDHHGGKGPLSPFWRAVHDLDPSASGESHLAGAREGDLVALCAAAGLGDAQPGALRVSVSYDSFADWWETFTLGVGPAGDHVTGLSEEGREALRRRCEELMAPAPFEIQATAWAVRALAATRSSSGQ